MTPKNGIRIIFVALVIVFEMVCYHWGKTDGYQHGSLQMHAAVDRWYAEHPQKCILGYDWGEFKRSGELQLRCVPVRP